MTNKDPCKHRGILASGTAGGKRLSMLRCCQPRKKMAATTTLLETVWVDRPTCTFPVFLSMPLLEEGKLKLGKA